MKDGGSLVLGDNDNLKKYKVDYSIGTAEENKGLVYDMETKELVSKETLNWILTSLSKNDDSNALYRIKQEDNRYK